MDRVQRVDKKFESTSGSRIARVILYVKDVAGVAAFYERHFGLRRLARGSAGNSIQISNRGMTSG